MAPICHGLSMGPQIRAGYQSSLRNICRHVVPITRLTTVGPNIATKAIAYKGLEILGFEL